MSDTYPCDIAIKNHTGFPIKIKMEDLFIDFAGFQKEKHPSRKAISELNAGDSVTLEIRNDKIELVDDKGVSVARLSESARHSWLHRLELIQEINVIAMVRRYKSDINEDAFKGSCHGESWELPVVEVIYG